LCRYSAITPDTWSRFCAVGSVSDFRAHKRYRMGSVGNLDLVPEGGEYPTKSTGDAELSSITATKRGAIISVTREMMINDDLNALTQLPAMLGRGASRTVESAVYAKLAENSGAGPTMGDTYALFHATQHGANLTTSAPITAAALDLDRQAMALQMEPGSNDYLDLRPVILLCGMAVGGAARVINESQYDPDTAANKSQMKPNLSKGLFRDIVDSPRISGTKRYLFADPTIAPVLEVAFLNGMREPQMEDEETFRTDSRSWKVRYEFGIAAVDFRGAVYNAGA
jgi:hypothetical protein